MSSFLIIYLVQIRIRSQNKMGASDFTKILIATTEDVPVRKELIVPSALNYIASEGVFTVQVSKEHYSSMAWIKLTSYEMIF